MDNAEKDKNIVESSKLYAQGIELELTYADCGLIITIRDESTIVLDAAGTTAISKWLSEALAIATSRGADPS